MTQPSGRALRLIGWTLGSVVAAAALVLLLLAGLATWYFQVAAPNHRREISEAEQQMSREAAASAQTALTAAASDGRLTDDEISTAIGGPQWDVRRADASWLVRAKFEGTDPVCFSYDITLPLGPETRVTSTELPNCPAITPAGQ
jgi:hypothetical protein